MSEEWFDVVDEHDRPLGRALRAEVHRLGLRHRSVHMLVFNAAGSVFLQKRSLAKDNCPGLWDVSAAGHVGAGEDYDAAAPRELAEELGCVPAVAPELLFALEAAEHTGWEFVRVYRVEAEGPFELDPVEIAEGRWFTPAEVDAWLAGRAAETTATLRIIWSRVRAAAASLPGADGR